MISDISKYVDFLTINNITPSQFLILWLVHTKDVNNIAKYKKTFFHFDMIDIHYLIDSGWIDDFGIVRNGVQTFNIYDFVVTDKFSKVVVIDELDAYEELCSAYPKWITIQGVKRPAVNGDPYKNAKEYFKCHKNNKLAHERIINITREYFKNSTVVEGIVSYILNRRWNLLEEAINKGVGQNVFKKL